MAQRFPEWVRQRWGSGEDFAFTKGLIERHGLHTVCQSARCPNMGECWRQRTATFLILGKVCTRDCSFCAVGTGRPAPVDASEPARIAQVVREMGLRHVVVTSVTRDDLDDGGAGQFAETIRTVRSVNPETTVEVLTPDFGGCEKDVETVLSAGPDVFGHNIETVKRLYPVLRRGAARYRTALHVLRTAAAHRAGAVVKSGFMLGHGETEGEVVQTLRDLAGSGCEAVAIGQYLCPTKNQREVASFVDPDQFKAYEITAYRLGFSFAMAGPLVRSSYRSGEVLGPAPAWSEDGYPAAASAQA